MNTRSVIYTLSSMLLLSACSHKVCNKHIEPELTPIEINNAYIDSTDVYLLDQYREQRTQFLNKANLEIDLSFLPDFEDSDSSAILFGSKENCVKVIHKLNNIRLTIADATNMFNILRNLLDSVETSYTYEDYPQSIPVRESLKYLISLMNRYVNLFNNGFNYIIPGVSVNDYDLVTAGLNCFKLESIISTNVKSQYSKLYPLLKQGTPNNLSLLFTEVAKDIPALSEKLNTIVTTYNEVCSMIINTDKGKVFLHNKVFMRNLVKNVKLYLNLLDKIKDYCTNANALATRL